MDKIVTRLKKKYRERLINCEKRWPPCVSNKPIKLELVERPVANFASYREQQDHWQQRTIFTYDDIFKVKRGGETVRKVLVEGDAGMGKTIFSNSIIEDWAHGKLFQQFELILLLPLSRSEVLSAKSIKQLLAEIIHSSVEVCETVSSYLKANEGDKVLIIADGWDKLNEPNQREDSIIYRFLFQKFPFLSVILTSRPTMSAHARLPSIHRVIMIHGFTEESIAKCIQSEFPIEESKADSLLQQLKDNPILESLCSIPLNCAIINHLWRIYSEKELLIPDTQTNLYTKIILNVVLRSIQNIEACKGIMSLRSFDSLPDCLQQLWWDLCNVAFTTLVKQKSIFSSEELESIAPNGLVTLEQFGLLQSTVLVGETGYEESIHFLHPLFQEYLAALHLLRNKQHVNISNRLLKSKSTLESLCIVWKLFIGIQFGSSQQVLKNTQPVKIAQLDMIKEILENFHWKGCFIAHCAYEAKGNLTDEVNEVFSKYFIKFQPCSTYDYACIVHVIQECRQYSCTAIDLEFLGLSDFQIKELGYALQNADNCHLKRLHLSGNNLTKRGIKDIFSNGSNALTSLSDLRLSYNPLQKSGLCALKKIVKDLPLRELMVLELCECVTDDSVLELASLTESVLAKCKHLKTLDLSYNPMGNNCEGVKALANFLSCVTVCQEEKLNMNESIQSVESTVSASFDSSQKSTSNVYDFIDREAEEVDIYDDVDEPADIQNLDLHLNGANLGREGVDLFIGVGYIQLNKLELQGNNINAAGTSSIAKSIVSGVLQINSLCLCDNPIDIEGFVALCKMLTSSDCHIKELFLCGCLTTKSTGRVREVLYELPSSPSQSLIHLGLNNNCLTEHNIHAVGGFLHVCPCIQFLHCNHCEISSDEISQLIETLQQSASDEYALKLRMWKLVGNKIDDQGVLNIISNLRFYPNVSEVDLGDNLASVESLAKLKKELRHWQHTQSDSDYSESEDSEDSSSSSDGLSSEQLDDESNTSGHDDSSNETLNESTINQESDESDTMTTVEDEETLLVSFHLAELDTGDLYTVETHLWDARHKWFFIGQALNISYAKLMVIEQNYQHNTDRCFTEMLLEWLRNISLPHTYGVLIEALKAKTVGLQDLAPKLLQYACYVKKR